MGLFGRNKSQIVSAEDALPGRSESMPVAPAHLLTQNPMVGPFPDNMGEIIVAMGCFWGAERKFWEAPGVWSTAVGYIAGSTPNPTYQEVCSGRTGHTEAVLAVFDTDVTSYDDMLRVFWESHNPTQGMRQGNDIGTQYRSGIYWQTEEERDLAIASKSQFQTALDAAGLGQITSEIIKADTFFYAEDYHQQYLIKNPNGYCGLGGTGVSCPVGVAHAD